MSGALPKPRSGSELQAVLAAERAGAAFLLLRDTGEALRIVPLPAGRATIGRNAENHVALPWDGEVSRVHAELEQIGGEWAVGDDGLSRNGTFLNGTRITKRQRLRDRDLLRIGNTMLMFRWERADAAAGTLASKGSQPAPPVTEGQRRVLVALCRPLKHGDVAAPASNQEIASELHLTVDAVRTHLRVLFANFDVGEMAQNTKRVRLAELALQHGVVDLHDV